MTRGVAMAGVALAVLALPGCVPQVSSEFEAKCLEQVAGQAGVSVDDLLVGNKTVSSRGFVDLSGVYPGGSFGCSGSTDSDEPTSVQVFPDL